MDRILITGVDTPLGPKIAQNLLAKGYTIKGAYSRPDANPPDNFPSISLPDPAIEEPWLELLDQVTHIIHLDEYCADSCGSPGAGIPDLAVTGRLACAAAAKGIKRFVYLSSVQAMSDQTLPGKPLAWRAVYQPVNEYGRIKLESERLIARHCAQAGVEWQIIRPAEVYGPALESRILKLVRLVQKKRFLAIGLTMNQLGFVYIDNLAEAIATAVAHPRGGNELLLISDGENISTPHLLRYIAHALDRWLVLLPLPLFLFRMIAKDHDVPLADQLIPTHSLAIDDSHVREALDWQPRLSTKEGIRDLVRTLALAEKQ